MPATRKVSREAQNQDLEQMKSLFGSPAPAVKQENPIETEKEAPKTVEQIQTVTLNTETPDSSKTTTDTTVGIRMTMQKNEKLKHISFRKEQHCHRES